MQHAGGRLAQPLAVMYDGATDTAQPATTCPPPNRGEMPTGGGGTRALILALLLLLPGCGFYSLTGASIPDDIQTVAIPLADLDAATPVSTLADDLTRLVIDRMVRQTRLDLETDEAAADAVLTLRITQYRSSPAALASDDRAQLTRVSISVQARYARQDAEEPIFDRSFRGEADYDPVAVGPTGEVDAAAIALAEIADDVFTAATSNW